MSTTEEITSNANEAITSNANGMNTKPDPSNMTLVEEASEKLSLLEDEKKALARQLKVAKKNKAQGVGAYFGTKIVKKTSPSPFALYKKSFTKEMKKEFGKEKAKAMGIEVKEGVSAYACSEKIIKKMWDGLSNEEKASFAEKSSEMKKVILEEQRAISIASQQLATVGTDAN